MKNLINIFSIVAIVAFGLTSCEKDEIQGPKIPNNSGKEIKNNKDGGGDDDDTIIVYGLTQTVLNDPISGATIVIYDEGGTTALDTTTSNSNGNFNFEVTKGNYSFEASASGFQTLTTENIFIKENDSNVTLTLIE